MMEPIFLASLEQINSNLIGSASSLFSLSAIGRFVGYLVFILVIVGSVGGYYYWQLQNKKFNIKVTAFKVINGRYQPWHRDRAKIVKIGKGGYELIYLKKLKTWKLIFGETIGTNDYYFFLDPIGYWYQGYLSGNLKYMNESGGLVPVVVTSPTMRAQYTSLEKQIDALHGTKQTFWEKYGNWVLSFSFLCIMGVFMYLAYREVGQYLGAGTGLADTMTKLADQMNRLAINLNDLNNNAAHTVVQQPVTGGLVPGSP